MKTRAEHREALDAIAKATGAHEIKGAEDFAMALHAIYICDIAVSLRVIAEAQTKLAECVDDRASQSEFVVDGIVS